MNAPPKRHTVPMQTSDVNAVMLLESQAYPVPWTHGNFVDAIAAGYTALLLMAPHFAGYVVAMPGVDEMHLLNITVASAHQAQGHGRYLLDEVVRLCRQMALPQLWLEVRASNERAQNLYRQYGFSQVGVRRNYYPLPHTHERENAVMMNLNLKAPHGLE
jgi:[ribosomal protein S18]-alanine N-acetyltransferase